MVEARLSNDAARMDRHYRFQRFIYDSTRSHYLIGRRHLIEDLKPAGDDRVLEIGCGTAWNLARVARRYPRARIYGVDVSNAMLDTARASLRRQGLSGRVMLRQGDATDFDASQLFGEDHFDRIFFSYALSMIPRWRDALAHATTLLSNGGSLHVVDFGQCERLPSAFRSGFFAFLNHYTVSPRADLETEITKAAMASGTTATFSRLHRGYTDYATLSRNDDRSSSRTSIRE